MAEIDQIAAVKASLELFVQDNIEMKEHFKDLMSKLTTIEQLPPGIKRVQFRQLEQSGALKFNGADIRTFTAKATSKPLTPSQFVKRTNRRLENTNSLIQAFMEKDEYTEGDKLKNEINELTKVVMDETDQKAVIDFKSKVETLRGSALFENYLKVSPDSPLSDNDGR